MVNGEIQVVDNGNGIDKSELDFLGKKLCKNNLIFAQYGNEELVRYEEVLSIITRMSDIIIIESLHEKGNTTYRQNINNILNTTKIKKVRNRACVGTTVSFFLLSRYIFVQKIYFGNNM